MPSVVVLRPSLPEPGFTSYSESGHVRQSNTLRTNHIPKPNMQNGSAAPSDNLSISEIEEKAREDVRKHTTGVSPISLLKSARTQLQLAQANEKEGNLKSALSALCKAGGLAALVMKSSEYVTENQPGRHGLLYKEFVNFQKVCDISHVHLSS